MTSLAIFAAADAQLSVRGSLYHQYTVIAEDVATQEKISECMWQCIEFTTLTTHTDVRDQDVTC